MNKEQPSQLGQLTTESHNPASSEIDSLSAIEIVRLMNQQDWQRVCSYDHEFIETWQHQSRGFIQDFARENQAFYFDPFPHFEEPLIDGINLYRDVDHLSNRGELHIAPHVSEVLDRAALNGQDPH